MLTTAIIVIIVFAGHEFKKSRQVSSSFLHLFWCQTEKIFLKTISFFFLAKFQISHPTLKCKYSLQLPISSCGWNPKNIYFCFLSFPLSNFPVKVSERREFNFGQMYNREPAFCQNRKLCFEKKIFPTSMALALRRSIIKSR